MKLSEQSPMFPTINCITKNILRLGVLVTIVTAQLLSAQTFTVLHAFTGPDGANPYGHLTMDRAGSLYGTTYGGGANASTCDMGCGTVFKLTASGSHWLFSPIYLFKSGFDGAAPVGSVTLVAATDRLYGTTSSGGNKGCGGPGCGTFFRLIPPVSPCKTTMCFWSETVLYRFDACCDGVSPNGDLVSDQSGNFYGTTVYGGTENVGTAFKLKNTQAGWRETVIHNFGSSQSDGGSPSSGMTLDQADNLYGTTGLGGANGGCGIVYQLTPAGSEWNENILYAFGGSDGCEPGGGVIFDPQGNLYGTTTFGGGSDQGTIFSLSAGNGGWAYSLVYTFTGREPPSYGPTSALVRDAAGNLYGTTLQGGPNNCPASSLTGCGNVFKLTPSGNSWIYTDLYDFTGGSDGAFPSNGVIVDANGNLYGTTGAGGVGPCSTQSIPGCGVVFEITP